MRQAHPAGERMFVDYAGQTIDLTDGRTSEIRPTQIFVAVMGASNYTYAEATLTQTLPDWIGAHGRALAFMGPLSAYSRLFGDLTLARGDGHYPRLMRALGGVKLLILDDWGSRAAWPEQRHDMLEIVEDRYGRGATLITSQLPVDRWHDLVGEPTLADAILDRIIHNAHRLKLTGDSSRKQHPTKTVTA
jgi:hypothetical protein